MNLGRKPNFFPLFFLPVMRIRIILIRIRIQDVNKFGIQTEL